MPIWYWIGVVAVMGITWLVIEVASDPGPDDLFASRASSELLIPVMIVLFLLLVVVIPRFVGD